MSNFKYIFGQIEDDRSHINRLHNLVDILLIGITSDICGAKTWEQMVVFAKSKETFLKKSKFLELPNGIPSKVTLNRVFSACACENNLVLGQVKTAEKSNEIVAIPELLDILNIVGNTITIDAMGTQKEIAEKIIDKNADYILAAKAN